MSPVGLYIHFPFCKSRCIYCGFYSTTDTGLKQRYVDALVAEAQSRSAEGEIATIYLGGGTPSQLSIFQMRQIFDALYSSYDVADNAEVTVECNPDDITESFYGCNFGQFGSFFFTRNGRFHVRAQGRRG